MVESESGVWYVTLLFHDNATGNTVSGITRRVGFEVVGLGVDYESGTPAGEDRMVAIPQIDPRIFDRNFSRSIGFDGEVLHVAGVGTFRILQPMMFHIGIEVSASGRE